MDKCGPNVWHEWYMMYRLSVAKLFHNYATGDHRVTSSHEYIPRHALLTVRRASPSSIIRSACLRRGEGWEEWKGWRREGWGEGMRGEGWEEWEGWRKEGWGKEGEGWEEWEGWRREGWGEGRRGEGWGKSHGPRDKLPKHLICICLFWSYLSKKNIFIDIRIYNIFL